MKRHVHADQDPGTDSQAEPHALVMRVSDTDGELTPWGKECLQIQHAEHLHAIFGNRIFLLDNADLPKAEAFHKDFDNLVMRNGLVCWGAAGVGTRINSSRLILPS